MSQQRLGRYTLLRELATGGMASVHLAQLVGDGGVRRLVALKRIHPHLGRDPAFCAMFLDEARIASRIHHPNVCQIFEYGEHEGVPFLVMELLVGEPLQRILERATGLEVAPALMATIVAEAADGLHAAHELKSESGEPMHVVHRDVSPQNVFVTYEGTIKVVDFGIAQAVGKTHHTETGTVKGKFAYMAPEQIAGEPLDRRADVWSLGVVLWEVLARRRLFRRPSPSETIRAVETDAIPPPSTHGRGVSPALDAIALRALARDREQRYESARALSSAIRAAIVSEGGPVDRATLASWLEGVFPDRLPIEQAGRAAPSSEPTPVTQLEPPGLAIVEAPIAPGPRRSRPLVLGTSLALAALASVGAWAVDARTGPEPVPAPTRSREQPALAPAPTSAALDTTTPPLVPAADEPAAASAPSVDPAPRSTRRHAIDRPRTDPPMPATTTVSPPAPEPVADAEGPGCATVGGGIRVVLPDGRAIEGPVRTPCVTIPAGPTRVRVESTTSEELLWERTVEVRPGATLAITANGVR